MGCAAGRARPGGRLCHHDCGSVSIHDDLDTQSQGLGGDYRSTADNHDGGTADDHDDEGDGRSADLPTGGSPNCDHP